MAVNKRWLRGEDTERLGDLLKPLLLRAYGRWEAAEGSAHGPESWYGLLVGSLQQESATLEQMVALSAFCLAHEPTRRTPEAVEALATDSAPLILQRFRETLTPGALTTPDGAAEYYKILRHYFRETAGLRGQMVMFPIRAALTGTLQGPCLGIVSSLLGWQRCVQRAENALGPNRGSAVASQCTCTSGRALYG